jgi:nucleoporin GLE1
MTEIQSLLSSLELERTEADDQAKREFHARNQLLWEGIDRTIAAVQAEKRRTAEEEKRQAEVRRKEEEEVQKKRDEERRKEEEKRKAEEARRNAEKAERERQEAEKAKRDAELKQTQAEEQQRLLEASRKNAEQNALTSLQKNEQRWEKWVEHQRRTKIEVIERVKADDGLKKNIGPIKRKITRRIGQIVNTRESIVSIVSPRLSDLRITSPLTLVRVLPLAAIDPSHPRGPLRGAIPPSVSS